MFWVLNCVFAIATLIDALIVNADYEDKIGMIPVYTFVNIGVYIIGDASLILMLIFTTKRSRHNPRFGALTERNILMGGDKDFWNVKSDFLGPKI